LLDGGLGNTTKNIEAFAKKRAYLAGKLKGGFLVLEGDSLSLCPS